MKRYLAAAVLLLFLLSLLPVSAQAEEVYALPVFETSDIHGFLVDAGYDDPADYQYRLAYVARIVDNDRKGDPDRTVLLDGGDIYQGNVVSNLQEGWPMSAAFDAMDYDAVALGNHEFDWGIELTADPDGTMPDYDLSGTHVVNEIPILCANIYYRGTSNRVDFTQDYVILEKTAVSAAGSTRTVHVAVIGYVDNYASSIMTSRFQDYQIKADLGPVETLARSLKDSGQAEAVILLAHAGSSSVAGRLSANTAVDLVCGGHTHYYESGTARAAYMQPSAQTQSYARCELRFAGEAVTVAGQTTVPVTAASNLSRLTDTAYNRINYLSAPVMAVSEAALAGVQEALTQPLGYVTTSITKNAIGDNVMSSTAGNWLTDLANRATGAQVSFTNNGGIRTNLYTSYGRRSITPGDIYTISPFGNRWYVYDVTYKDLLSFLSYGLGYGSGLSLRMSGIDCYYRNNTVSALVLEGVCIYKNGTWAPDWETRPVRVAANEFIATSSGTPFYKLNNTALADSSLVDNESAIEMLKLEAAQSDGFLYVDPAAHWILGTYEGDLTREYTVTTGCSVGGSISPTVTVREGEDVTVTVTPDPGYLIDHLTVDGVRQDPAPAVTFQNIRADHMVLATFAVDDRPCDGGPDCPSSAFTDVPGPEDWSHAGIDFCVERGLFAGTSETAFSPKLPMSRAMAVTVLWRLAGSPGGFTHQFTDLAPGSWYEAAVAWAAAEGVAAGVGNGRFDPDADLTREQLAAMLYRYHGLYGDLTDDRAPLDTFPDVGAVSPWAGTALSWAVGSGLLSGVRENGWDYLRPQATADRDQVASILMRYLLR